MKPFEAFLGQALHSVRASQARAAARELPAEAGAAGGIVGAGVVSNVANTGGEDGG